MASKQRRTVTTPNRAIAERIAEMIRKMGACTDRVESKVWARLTQLDHEDICAIRDRTIADLFALLEPGDACEVEMLIWQRLEEQEQKEDCDELLATRTRTIATIIAQRVTRMAPGDAKQMKAMISSVLEEHERELSPDNCSTKPIKLKVSYTV
jgi:hypothetical protein